MVSFFLIGQLIWVGSASAAGVPDQEKDRACLTELSARVRYGIEPAVSHTDGELSLTAFPGSALVKGGNALGVYVLARNALSPTVPKQYFCKIPDPKVAKTYGTLSLQLPDFKQSAPVTLIYQRLKEGTQLEKGVMSASPKPLALDCSSVGESQLAKPLKDAMALAAKAQVQDSSLLCEEQNYKVAQGDGKVVRGACCAVIKGAQAAVHGCSGSPVFKSVRDELEKDANRKLSLLPVLWGMHNCATNLGAMIEEAPEQNESSDAAPAKP